MQNQSFEKLPHIYRPYHFPSDFPIWAFLGDYWKLDTLPPKYLHFHNALEIGHCIDGEGLFFHKSLGTYTFESDAFSISYPQVPHIACAQNTKASWEYLFIDLQNFPINNPIYTPELLRIFSMPQRVLPIITAQTMPFLHDYLKQLFMEMHEKKAFYQNAVSGLLIAIISELNHHTTLTESSDSQEDTHAYSYISKALDYIYEHYSENISIQEIATYCHISESHFRRLFVSIVGISPLDFIHHHRINQACNLLQKNQYPINTIAHKVGYKTLSSFNRQFQQYLNTSPRNWQKQNCTETQSNRDVLSFDHLKTKYIFNI